MMSVVNVGELWYNIARTHSAKQADSIIAELRTLKIALIDADWELTQQAAAFKAKGKIAYADTGGGGRQEIQGRLGDG